MSDDRIDNSMIETLKESNLPSVLGDLGEITIDSIFEEGVLKELPIISTMIGLWRTGVTIRDFIFIRKLLKFLEELSEVPRQERIEMIERLEKDTDYRDKVGEEIVLLLDRLDSVEKAKFTGRAFSAYCKGYIDVDTLRRINYAIDRVLLRDLSELNKFSSDPGSVKPATLQNFINAGLAYTVPVFEIPAVVKTIPNLLRDFLRYVLKENVD